MNRMRVPVIVLGALFVPLLASAQDKDVEDFTTGFENEPQQTDDELAGRRAEAATPAPATPAPVAEVDVEVEPAPAEVSDFDPVSWTTRPQDRCHLDRGINILTARPVRPLALQGGLDLRAAETFVSKHAGRDLLGLDAPGLKLAIALRFGIIEDLDFGIARLNGAAEAFDTYDFDARYRVLNQRDHFLDASARVGGTWFYQPAIDDAMGGFGQLALNRTFFDRLGIGAGLLYHSSSTNDRKTLEDEDWSMAVTGLLEVRIASYLSWQAEVGANVAGYGEKWPVWATSFKVITHRHVFSTSVSSSQYVLSDGLAANTWRGLGDVILGFTIIREFSFGE